MLHKRILVGALVLVAAACSSTTTATEDELVSLVFDGTTCHYEGPASVEEGTVDFRFVNESSEGFAVAAISGPGHYRRPSFRDPPTAQPAHLVLETPKKPQPSTASPTSCACPSARYAPWGARR